MRLAPAAATLLVLGLACGGGREPAKVTSPLPAGGFAPGWTAAALPESVGPGGLYARIDGGAEVFLKEGFRELLTATYTGPGGELEVELYVMGDPPAARRVWERQGRAGGTVEGLPGPAAVDRYQLATLLHCCLLVVNNPSGNEEAVGVMEALARAVAARVPEVCPG